MLFLALQATCATHYFSYKNKHSVQLKKGALVRVFYQRIHGVGSVLPSSKQSGHPHYAAGKEN